ncbi:MAG: SRPBCC family protein [bacterium]
MLVSVVVWAAGRTPPPSDKSELREAFKITWNQEVLPEGAKAGTLASLLSKGQVVMMNDDPPGGIPWTTAAGVMVDAPVDLVFSTATDFESYPEVVPMTDGAVVEPVSGMDNLYEVTFNVEILFSWLSVEYSVYHYHRPPFRTDWTHAAGEFDINSGFWRTIPADANRRTMTFYSVYSLPRQEKLKKLYAREPTMELMTNVCTATMVVRAMKEESEKRFGKDMPALKESRDVEEILMDDPESMRLMSEQGKIVVLEEGPTVYVTAGTLVDTPCGYAFSVVSDFGKYDDYLPGIREAEVLRQGEKGPVVRQVLDIKLWELNLTADKEIEYTLEKPKRISWTIDRSRGGPIEGYWRFLPQDNNTKCLIFNGTTEDLRSMSLVSRAALRMVPTLEHGLLASITTAGMDAIKKRIEQKE